MNKAQLIDNIRQKKSFLCVGLDTDLKKIPQHLLSEEDPLFAFNKAIIDATAPYCVAYKPNLAFYECFGLPGWIAFEKTVKYIKDNYPDQFIIAGVSVGTSATHRPCTPVAFLKRWTSMPSPLSPLYGRGQCDAFPPV